MRNHVVHARAGGVNLAFLGGNEIYRHIRLDPTPLGDGRLETDYKSFTEDPAIKTDPLAATQEWRSPPTPRPESAILGNFYQCNPVNADLVVADSGNWLLHGIGGVPDHVLHPTHQPDRRRVPPGEVPGLDAPTAPRHAQCRPGDGTSIDELTAAADTAMYTAKTAGRDCVRHAENSLNPTTPRASIAHCPLPYDNPR